MKPEVPDKPEIGMGATRYMGSDCYPYTIVGFSKKTILVTRDDAKLVSGSDQTGDAVYEYIAQTNQEPEIFTLRKDGQYHRKGESIRGTYLIIGHRRLYQDPHF
jgi:hypothetical protein